MVTPVKRQTRFSEYDDYDEYTEAVMRQSAALMRSHGDMLILNDKEPENFLIIVASLIAEYSNTYLSAKEVLRGARFWLDTIQTAPDVTEIQMVKLIMHRFLTKQRNTRILKTVGGLVVGGCLVVGVLSYILYNQVN